VPSAAKKHHNPAASVPATDLVLKVALDTPLRRVFDYLAPPDMAGRDWLPGVRLKVPFGRQSQVGVLVATAAGSELPRDKLRAALQCLDPEPVFSPELLDLLQWASAYYHHPLGNVLFSALPGLARDGAPVRRSVETWSVTPSGAVAALAGEPRRAPRQRALLARVAGAGATESELSGEFGDWRPLARALLKRGWIASAEIPESLPANNWRDESHAVSPGPELSPEQSSAVSAINAAAGRYQSFLLRGITGSGKTEVYLHAAAATLAHRQQILILVPEIALTPQLIGRFEQRFGAAPTVFHSALTDNERLTTWRRCLLGQARIVLGTRSAVFAPLPELGLIVIDEEHDASFKQQQGGFRYSARDLALVRAQKLAIPIVLGSATPSLESLQNAASERYHTLELPRRAGSALPPVLKLVDLRGQTLHNRLAGQTIEAIDRHLKNDGQVLVYLNRRGYAPTLVCTACGWIAPCTQCDARLTIHRLDDRLRCHHCGAERPLLHQCPQCGYAVKPVGQGTERVEETLMEMFPTAPLVRLDRDVVRNQADLTKAYEQLRSGHARLLVGTQMVTKGHDFPMVTLVVVLNADQGLFSIDYRAAERLAQALIQVAGRAGRGSRPGEVLIQTEHPEHPMLQKLLTEGYDGFAAVALEERRAARWPPFLRLAALRASAESMPFAVDFLRAARQAASQLRDRHGLQAVSLNGPAPASMARRADRYHAQLLVESVSRSQLQQFLGYWVPQVEALPGARRVRFALDVDPLESF
jgi:primosomal protein N' (replication factor Y)